MDKSTDGLGKPVPKPRFRELKRAVRAAVRLHAVVLQSHETAKREIAARFKRRALELRIRRACGGLSFDEQVAMNLEMAQRVAEVKMVFTAHYEILPFGKVRWYG